ncbi:MAG TPA: TetR/AcrR family transcriptional regulator [Verrucomicrobiae bacterium]|nr:TetR/AcrR family transcriptional regulator [Verrucomicrobiae bacterium]
MARRSHKVPSTERRTQILRAATKLFATQGFNGTTTREIADRVGVKETILFRLFPSKRELYWAVIDEKTRAVSSRQLLERQLAAAANERKMFVTIARDILERNTKDSTLTRLLLFSGLEEHGLSERFFQTYIAEYYEVLASYIRRRIREGAYRPVDPMLSARGFLGMVFNYFLIQELFGAHRHHKFDIRHVSETLTDIWLNGMQKK